MASIIRVKRSTGATAPSTINYGELAVTMTNGTQANGGGRLYVGNNDNPDSNPISIGGKYYTDMMSTTPGTVAGGANANGSTLSNGFIPILDVSSAGSPGLNATGLGAGTADASMPRVDQWNVDNLTIDGNTIYSNDSTNNDINFVTNGSPGSNGHIVINDDTKLSFGANKDASIEYDEDGTDKVQVTGKAWVYNSGIEIVGGTVIDNIGISSNVISTKTGGGNTLYLDPYPDGLSSDGLVVVKGSLQVDGTTTTVNSTNATVNDPVMVIGDVTSVRTVTATVGSGTSAITLDGIVGVNTGDTITGSSALPGAGTTTIAYYGTAAGISTVYITGQTTAGITTTTQLTITHGYDTNTDRGIAYNYNTSSGISNNKTGFFGMNDSAGESNTNVPERSWTFIPDATVTGNVAAGVRGFLDVKGIYYQGATSGSGDWWSSGAAYFDSTGKLTSTSNPAAGISTSNYILTTNASGIPVWTTTIDGGQF